ncbi:MAG: histidinol-phosphate transaminase [Coriobacteriales bacterium]|nr:histidinol-phosphate transaminase [Coriobacteriales bacterium]
MADRVRQPSPRIQSLEPYDPKYLEARISLNANENPYGIPASALTALREQVSPALLSRYPDPLAKRLRAQLAQKHGVPAECILLGNGGDELLFDICLAYGGPTRKLLVAPPTFSVYSIDAALTETQLVEVRRLESAVVSSDRAFESRTLTFEVSEQEVLAVVSAGDSDIVMLASPNNPTGDCLSLEFIQRLLAATDAVVLIDHAYIEFADKSYNAEVLLSQHKNLAILRTFSKAYALAGMRIGYLLASEEITHELLKVRQPYSVDSLAALAALTVLAEQTAIDDTIARIVAERERMYTALSRNAGLLVVPSQANYLLFRTAWAHELWQHLYERHGILIRDLSRTPGLSDCLRVSIGQPAENDEFLNALSVFKDNGGSRLGGSRL